VHISRYDRVLVPILLDLLPDKIANFKGCVRNLRYFMRCQSIMDRLYITTASEETCNFNVFLILCFLDYAMIFKTKAKVIRLDSLNALMDLSRFDV
jgi:hypothetical protein